MNTDDKNGPTRVWKFFRAGGFDQVQIDDAEDLFNLEHLDQKLWVALSCPVKGLQFDERTLSLIDTDQDGHVRAPELLAAIDWVGERLAARDRLGVGGDGLALHELRADTDPGRALRELMSPLLAGFGKDPDAPLTVADAVAAQALQAARAKAAWQAQAPNPLPLGAGSEAGWKALQAVSAKLDDYFLRCRVAAFEGRSDQPLDFAEELVKSAAAPGPLSTDSLGSWPLARVTGTGRLALNGDLNPVWAGALATFREAVVVPLKGARAHLLGEPEWREIQALLAPYGAWLAACPDDKAPDPAVTELEKLVRLVRDLMTLANNFVAFRSFYQRHGPATFQAGTLYLDGRSCELCVNVNDPAKHGLLANLSRICLVYCDCQRGGARMTIAAAFTAGDSDQLMVGRNGVFYDPQGNDWDATIVKILDNPISLRQAFWSPYKKLVRALGDQFQKFAASRASAADAQLSHAAGGTVGKAVVGKPVPPSAAQQAFDVGKFAGIFAAIGLAVGAIGTALASVMVGLLSLKAWQIPLVILGVMAVISGPSILLAWFKLRTRTLGPILDANGWAINARARINIPFGTSLTRLAQLPAGAERSLSDPYAEKETSPWSFVFWGVLFLLLIGVGVWLSHQAPH